MTDQLRALRDKARTMPATVNIGKNGLTPHVIHQIQDQLKARKLIKVKILPSAITSQDRKEFASNLAATVGARLIDQIGHVVVLQEK